jgi:hypothetical protein
VQHAAEVLAHRRACMILEDVEQLADAAVFPAAGVSTTANSREASGLPSSKHRHSQFANPGIAGVHEDQGLLLLLGRNLPRCSDGDKAAVTVCDAGRVMNQGRHKLVDRLRTVGWCSAGAVKRVETPLRMNVGVQRKLEVAQEPVVHPGGAGVNKLSPRPLGDSDRCVRV